MNKGFTLVELIAVVVILGLLVILTTPAYDSVSKNIKTRNYESKKSTIKSETLSYVEKYLKDIVYSGTTDQKKGICLTVDYLIKNGIVSSDSETKEYIENDITGEKYYTEEEPKIIYIKVIYDYKNLKLVALSKDETQKIYDDIDDSNDIIFKFNDITCDNDNTY